MKTILHKRNKFSQNISAESPILHQSDRFMVDFFLGEPKFVD